MRMDANRLVLTMIEDDIYRNYDKFACSRQVERPENLPKDVLKTAAGNLTWTWPSGSLESLHGLYHGLAGGAGGIPGTGAGGGHMSRVATAAFDPIFVSIAMTKD